MTLQEALATTRRVRLGSTGGYKSREELTISLSAYTVDQLISEEWVAEPAAITLTKEQLATVWNDVAGRFSNVKGSSTSPLFAQLASELFD